MYTGLHGYSLFNFFEEPAYCFPQWLHPFNSYWLRRSNFSLFLPILTVFQPLFLLNNHLFSYLTLDCKSELIDLSSVQSLSCVQLFATPWTAARQESLSFTISQSCHPTSLIPFSCLQSFPASGSFPMNQFFTPAGQSIGVSASASVLPMNIGKSL